MKPKRLTLFAGHYGSGKTNIALNYARFLHEQGLPVTIADLDIVNPYFRTKDSEAQLASEGIGLIEAMGLFILPPRLKRQFAAMEAILTGAVPYDAAAIDDPSHDLYVHRRMLRTLLSEGQAKDGAEAEARVRAYVNRVCAGILENTAVFKHDENGTAGFEGFMRALQLTKGE